MVYCRILGEKYNSREKQFRCYFLMIIFNATMKWHVLRNYTHCKNKAKITLKGSTLTYKWSRSNKDVFQVELFQVCFIYLILPSQNFVTFLSKRYKENLFFAGLEIFTFVPDIFEHVLNLQNRILEASGSFPNKGKKFMWRSYSQNFMINVRKYCNKIKYTYNKKTYF